MTKLRLYSCATLLLAAAAAHADPISLQPGSSISGMPGSTIGWGFTLAPDPQFAVSIIGSFLIDETDPSLGSYSDIASYLGGPSQGLLQPGGPSWIAPFVFNTDPSQETGLGSFEINPGAQPGESDSGSILVEYETFDVSPACMGCYVASSVFEVPFTVTVSDVPEPSTFSMVLGILGVAIGWRKKRRA
jgi:PEP-CTERM motif